MVAGCRVVCRGSGRLTLLLRFLCGIGIGGYIPCRIFDAARDKYFTDVLLPAWLKYGYNPETSRQGLKCSDLPTNWTLWNGTRREGCIE